MRPRQLPLPQHSDNSLQPHERPAAPKRRRDDKIGAPAFFTIRHLGAQDVGKAGLAHSRPAHDPFTLQAQGRRHDQHQMTPLDPAAFKEQRNVEDDKPLAAGARLRNDPPLGPAHDRMKDRLEAAQRRRVAKHQLTEAPAIDPSGFVGGALPHPERAAEAENDHRAAANGVTTAARSSRVTRTGVPNQASNPGRP